MSLHPPERTVFQAKVRPPLRVTVAWPPAPPYSPVPPTTARCTEPLRGRHIALGGTGRAEVGEGASRVADCHLQRLGVAAAAGRDEGGSHRDDGGRCESSHGIVRPLEDLCGAT